MKSKSQRRQGITRGQLILALAICGALLVVASNLAMRLGREPAATADIAAQARQYLEQRSVNPLSASLVQLLAESTQPPVPSLPHPLLDKPAPDFQLVDHSQRRHSLSEHWSRGPLVLVFYFGYYCDHCVSQLFALDADIAKFRELGAEVVAISADSPQETTQKFDKHGPFSFTVLSDPGNQVAVAYSVFAPQTASSPEKRLHGTFVIDREGIVRWCQYDVVPFTNNAALLIEVAKARQPREESAP